MNKFFKSIDFIENNLNERISIHEIAGASFQSTYHFSRIFKALVGDSPKEYLRKRRLSLAANNLLNNDDPVIKIALDCQFESQEAFTRAFKKHFKVTPAKYRKNKATKKILYRDKFTPESLLYFKHNFTMEPKIITQAETKVIGFLSHYKDGDFDILEIWKPFTAYCNNNPINNIASPIGIGLYEESTSKSNDFSYVCSVPVHNFDDVPSGMITRVIPSQLYAKFTHKGPLTNLEETLRYIWGSWLPKSSYSYEEASDFELYPANFNSNDPEAVTYIHIPIKLD